jgi:hypothetical protein
LYGRILVSSFSPSIMEPLGFYRLY